MNHSQSLQERIDQILRLPASAIRYELTKVIAGHFAGLFVLPIAESLTELAHFAAAGECVIEDSPELFAERVASWDTGRDEITTSDVLSLRRVRWREHQLEVFDAEWMLESTSGYRTFLAGASRSIVEQFYEEYIRWTLGVRDEVMVFERDQWTRDRSFYRAIQSASFDQIVLEDSLKAQIVADIERFFASRDLYRELGLPWKRGALFVGPPGNGKTLTIRALAKHLKVPVLYAKSFVGSHDVHYGIRSVFQRARQTPGCMMVLEDLDTLVTDHNRSFFLNELDGFSRNEGLCIIATTNHPEALDSAIVERPSRFDRKYHFTLPAKPLRRRMVEQWFGTRVERARPSEHVTAQIAAETEGFSFAYLNELCVSATMAWVSGDASSVDEALVAQCKLLRAQMSSKRIAGLVAPIAQHR